MRPHSARGSMVLERLHARLDGEIAAGLCEFAGRSEVDEFEVGFDSFILCAHVTLRTRQ